MTINDIQINLAGKRETRPAIAFAMYACQYYGASSLKDITKVFQLGHVGSASFSINKVKQEIVAGMWKKEIKRIEKVLYIVK